MNKATIVHGRRSAAARGQGRVVAVSSGRLSAGGFRTICDIQDERITVVVVKVGHRKDVYR